MLYLVRETGNGRRVVWDRITDFGGKNALQSICVIGRDRKKIGHSRGQVGKHTCRTQANIVWVNIDSAGIPKIDPESRDVSFGVPSQSHPRCGLAGQDGLVLLSAISKQLGPPLPNPGCSQRFLRREKSICNLVLWAVSDG